MTGSWPVRLVACGGRGARGGNPFIVANAVEPGAYIVKRSVVDKERTTTAIVEPDDLR